LIDKPYPTDGKFWLHHVLWPLVFILFALIFLEHQQMDIMISTYFFDQESKNFPLTNDFLFKNILHAYGNYPARIVFVGIIVFAIATIKSKYRSYRGISLYLLSSLGASAAVTVLIKMSSSHYCPWDLQIFNGKYPLLGLFDSLPAGLEPGRCWPSGFVIGAFCLFAFYFISLGRTKRSTSILLLLGILVYGNLLGIVQVMRGAHLFSHHLWTGVICWYVSLFCFAIFNAKLKNKAMSAAAPMAIK
jgi:membrane-associated PAP2 superfamily phosphatase